MMLFQVLCGNGKQTWPTRLVDLHRTGVGTGLWPGESHQRLFLCVVVLFSNSFFYYCTPLLSCLLKGVETGFAETLLFLSLCCCRRRRSRYCESPPKKEGRGVPGEYEKGTFSSLACTLDYIGLARPSISYKVAIPTLCCDVSA